MPNRAFIAFIAFTVLWVAVVAALTRSHIRSEMRRLSGAAANVWLRVIPPTRQ